MLRMLCFLTAFAIGIATAGPSFAWIHGVGRINTWFDLPEGAGGYQTSMDMASDGTSVIRCDVFGAYILNTTLGNAAVWKNVINTNSIPAAYWLTDANNGGLEYTSVGVYEIRFAPSNSNIMYMQWGGYLWASSNKGTNWNGPYCLLSGTCPGTGILPGSVSNGWYANDSYRINSQKMAVDPNNPYLVIVGTPTSGIFFVDFAGNLATAPTVTLISSNSIPNPGTATAGYEGIAFDPASGTTGGNTNTIYVVPYGKGLYVSTNAGSSWAQAPGGGPSIAHFAKVYGGVYYVADNSKNLYTYTGGASGSWSKVITSGPNNPLVFDFDPFVANRMVASGGCELNVSTDAGTTWSGWTTDCSMTATDIPWQAELSPYMGTSAMFFDQNTQNKLWVSGSNDHWHITISTITTGVNPVWISQGKGIEEFVANMVIVPPGGGPVMTNWDRAVFTLPNNFSFPISQAMSPTPQPYTDVNAGWSIDYASSSPSFMVVVAQGQYVNSSYSWPSYSTNYGVSWTAWPSTPEAYPGATNAGSIAASTSSNWIYWPSSSNNNSVGTQPWFTTNGGTSWSVVSLANPALGATTGTGLSSPTTTGAPTSGLATMTVGSCAKAVAGESVYDNTVGATLGQIISCVSTTLTLNQNPPSESYGATDALYFFGVPDIQNTAATSSWLTSNNTISVASCSNIFAGEAVLDSTTSLRTVGTVASCSSTTLTLTGDASVASEGSSDSLWFSAWGEGGSGQGGYTNISKLVAADRVNANTFYLYFGYGTASSYSGVYVTTNGGASWTFAANVAFGFTAGSIQTTPNEAGDLWFCGGPYPTGSHPGNSQFSHSSDRGSTWTSPTVNVKECAGLGFGAPKVSGNYPTIYSATWYNGGSGVTYNFGIYRSADEGVTWSQVCDANCSQFPLNSLSQIHWVSGDMNQYGSVYLGTNNNGFSWGIFP